MSASLSRLLLILLLGSQLLPCHGHGYGSKVPDEHTKYSRHHPPNHAIANGNEQSPSIDTERSARLVNPNPSPHRYGPTSHLSNDIIKSRTPAPSVISDPSLNRYPHHNPQNTGAGVRHRDPQSALINVDHPLQPANSDPSLNRYTHYDTGPDVTYRNLSSPPLPSYIRRPPNHPDTCTHCAQVCEPVANTILNFVRVGLRRIGDAFIESLDTEKLYLDDNDIVEISSKAFTSLNRLQLLSLSKNQLPTDKLLWFSTHYTLQKLILDDNRPNGSSSSVEEIFEKMPRLEELSLKRDGISRFGVDLKTFAPKLTHLDLSGNSIDELDFLDNLPDGLTHLHLDDNQIAQMKSNFLKNVEVMSVSGNNIKKLCYDQCSKSFLSLEGLRKLNTLNLSRNSIKEVTEDAFHDTKHLIRLDLSHNHIKTLPSVVPKLLTELEELYLSHNLLGTVPNICSLSRLMHLDLSYNNIGVVNADNFCGPSYKVHLTSLLLAGNHITEADNDAFIYLLSLEKLDLSNNLIVNLPIKLITEARSLRILLLTNNSINNIDKLFTARSTVLRDLHLEENPFCAVKYSNASHLVIHLQDEPKDEQYTEKTVENDPKDNSIADKDDSEY